MLFGLHKHTTCTGKNLHQKECNTTLHKLVISSGLWESVRWAQSFSNWGDSGIWVSQRLLQLVDPNPRLLLGVCGWHRCRETTQLWFPAVLQQELNASFSAVFWPHSSSIWLFRTQNCAAPGEFKTYPVPLYLGRIKCSLTVSDLACCQHAQSTSLDTWRALLLKNGHLQATNSWVQLKRPKQFLCSLFGEARRAERGTSSTWACFWSHSCCVLSAMPAERPGTTWGWHDQPAPAVSPPGALCLVLSSWKLFLRASWELSLSPSAGDFISDPRSRRESVAFTAVFDLSSSDIEDGIGSFASPNLQVICTPKLWEQIIPPVIQKMWPVESICSNRIS